MSHTEGKLAINGDRLESEKDHGCVNDGWIIAKCEGPDAFDNVRRLAACWNALEGISTDAIESYPLSVNGMVHVDIIKQERDTLKVENERLRRDAERLEWLVENCLSATLISADTIALDRPSIDAAMKEKQ